MNETTKPDAAAVAGSDMLLPVFIGQRLLCFANSRGFASTRTEYVVSKIGKKYFYVEENNRLKFDKETLQHIDNVYTQNNVQLYRTEQEIQDIKERNRLYNTIREYFSYGRGKSLSMLREIMSIIERQ